MDKTNLVMQLDKQWQECVMDLEHKLEQARKCSQNIVTATQTIRLSERTIETKENVLVTKVTAPDGIINGKNEETRKAQRIAFLSEQRQSGDLAEDYASLAQVQDLLSKSQLIFDETKDELEIARMQVHHIDAMLRALGG